jgi:hypothetical protein
MRVEEARAERVFGRFRRDVTFVGGILGPVIDPEDWRGLASY